MFENVLNAVRTFVLGFALIASTLSAQNVVLTQSPVTAGDQFGRSVDIDGSYAVVGAAAYDPAAGANAGAAFIYKQDGGTWTQEAVLLAGDASDNLGISAAISGTRAVVGAYNAEPGGLWAAGAAYVFTRNSGTGSWDRVQLVPSDPQMAINFGFSVDIDGDTIIVGAYNYDEGGFVNDNDGAISNSGTVYVFQFDGTNWIQQARLTAPAAEITDSRRFGHSVSIDGDVLLVGAMTADETGKAYVFTRSGSTWSAPVELVPSITAPNARYGQAVSLDLPHAIVGAGNLGAAGTAFIFRLDAGTWTETASLVAPDLEATSLFGTAVSIRGDVALIGAPQDDFSGLINPGSVRLYRLSGGNWTHEQVLTAETPANGHALVITPTIIIYYPGFGFSTAFDGLNAIVGDHNRPPAYQGAAEIISLADPANVSITKTLTTAGPYFHGQSVAYTLLVSNAGTGAATNVTVTDTPTNLSVTAVSGGGCATLPCTIPTLAAASSVSINVTATITAPGAFDNSATATAFEPDPDTTNNTDSTGNGGTAAPLADVSVAKTLITGPPYVHGQTIAYTIEVQNAGPSTASAIVVTDTPQNLTLTSVASASCVALPCSIPSLAAGATETINVTALITAPGAFDNTAQAVGTELDPVPANNVDASGNGGTATAAAESVAGRVRT